MYQARKNKISIKKIAKFLKINYTGKDFYVESISSLNNIKNNSILFYSALVNFQFKIKDNVNYDLKKLEKFKNVHFLGERPYSELPKYLHGFDVCLIPFKNVPLIEATHPVKIYEYLAAGKPVVATKMLELLPIKDLCYIANTHEEFLSMLEQALQEKSQDLIEKRIAYASKNTWTSRFESLYSKLTTLDSVVLNQHN